MSGNLTEKKGGHLRGRGGGGKKKVKGGYLKG